MEMGEKIRRIRMAEGLTQAQMSAETGIGIDSLRQWEQGKRKRLDVTAIIKITENQRFEKYTLWLMTGKTAPEAGQISPELEEVRHSGAAG